LPVFPSCIPAKAATIEVVDRCYDLSRVIMCHIARAFATVLSDALALLTHQVVVSPNNDSVGDMPISEPLTEARMEDVIVSVPMPIGDRLEGN
jgi:hypothetical protein